MALQAASTGAETRSRPLFLRDQIVLATNSGAKKLFWPARIGSAMSELAAYHRPNKDRMSLVKPGKGRDAVYLVEYIYSKKSQNIGWASWDDILPLEDEHINRLIERQKFPAKYNKEEFIDSVSIAKQMDQIRAPEDYSGLIGTPFHDGVTLGAAQSDQLYQKDDFVTLKDSSTHSVVSTEVLKKSLITVFLLHYFYETPGENNGSNESRLYAVASEFACLPEKSSGVGACSRKIIGCLQRAINIPLTAIENVVTVFNVSTKKGIDQLAQTKDMVVYDFETPHLDADLELTSTAATSIVVNPICGVKGEEINQAIKSCYQDLKTKVSEAASLYTGEGQVVEAPVAVRAHEDQPCVLCGCKSPVFMEEDYDLDLGPMIGYVRGRLWNGYVSGLPVAGSYYREVNKLTGKTGDFAGNNPDFARVIWMHCYCFYLGINNNPDIRTVGPECNVVSWVQANRLNFCGSEPYDKEPLALINCGRRECKRRFHLPSLLMYGWGVCENRCLTANKVHPFLKRLMDTSDPTLLARPPVDVNMPEGFAHGWLMSYDAPQGLFSVLLDDGNAITVGKRHMTWMAPEAGHRGTRLIDQRDLGRNVIISRTLSEHEESWSQSPLVADNSGIARFDDESVPSGVATRYDLLLQTKITMSNSELNKQPLDQQAYLSLAQQFGAAALTIELSLANYSSVYEKVKPKDELTTTYSPALKKRKVDGGSSYNPQKSVTPMKSTGSSSPNQKMFMHVSGKTPRFPPQSSARTKRKNTDPGFVAVYANPSRVTLKQVANHQLANSFVSPFAPESSTSKEIERLRFPEAHSRGQATTKVKPSTAKKSAMNSGEDSPSTAPTVTKPPLSTDWQSLVNSGQSPSKPNDAKFLWSQGRSTSIPSVHKDVERTNGQSISQYIEEASQQDPVGNQLPSQW